MQLHERLSELLKPCLGPDGKPLKGSALASDLNVKGSAVCQWLNGKETPSDGYLAEIVEKFIEGGPSEKRTELVNLLLLAQLDRARKGTKESWTDSRKQLVTDALQHAIQQCDQAKRRVKTKGRTLLDFPDAFLPLAVIAADRREDSESHINLGDFGAITAAPTELRWVFGLRLPPGVELFGDKLFLLESADELRSRFGKKNLLVIGSLACNHFSRRLLLSQPKPGWRRGAPVFRFNVKPNILVEIERFLDSLEKLNQKQLVGKKGEPDTASNFKNWAHHLFHASILDPSYLSVWRRASDIAPNRDFGLVSLARNPFCDPADSYVCILAAGFHLFGTAHAIRFLSEPRRFKPHPLGGVLRVDIDDKKSFVKAFATRFDESRAEWDNEGQNSDYHIEDLVNGLKRLNKERPTGIHITQEEIHECLEFIESL